MTKSKLTIEDDIALKDEIMVLNELQHPHIIRLYDVYEEKDFWYLVTEKMSGGELFDRIVAKSYYNEKEARDVCKILFQAIGHCHNNSVAHRDLKPENLLLRSEVNDSEIKIADFGFAKKVLTPNSLTTQCGTPGYVAPEILEGIAYDTKSDMWSLGVIIYILLGGYPPFIEQNQRELFRKIRKGNYEFHEEYWGSVSADAKDLISCLLTVQPAKRLSADQALKHKWMTQDDSVLAGQDLGTNLSELRKYNAKRKFKAAVNAVSENECYCLWCVLFWSLGAWTVLIFLSPFNPFNKCTGHLGKQDYISWCQLQGKFGLNSLIHPPSAFVNYTSYLWSYYLGLFFC